LDVRFEGNDFRVSESAGNLKLVMERGDQRVYQVVE